MLVPGVWGPYYSVLVPDLWIHEGGQSAAGKLVNTLNTLSDTTNGAALVYLGEEGCMSCGLTISTVLISTQVMST